MEESWGNNDVMFNAIQEHSKSDSEVLDGVCVKQTPKVGFIRTVKPVKKEGTGKAMKVVRMVRPDKDIRNYFSKQK